MEQFDLYPGRVIASKYEVVCRLGAGWEGEVYKIVESATGIECAAKLFYPERNPKDRTAVRYAQKLHDLRDCPIVIKYHTHEKVTCNRTRVTALISEYVEGELLSEYLRGLGRKRLSPFQAAHLLHALAVGLEGVHFHGRYHGDLHPENVIVCRVGLHYELKFLDLYDAGGPKRDNVANDICDAVRVFYDTLGGRKEYANQPRCVKEVCCGLKRSLILGKFRTASALRLHLESIDWG